MKKRLLALILSLAVCLSLLPAAVFADEPEIPDSTMIDGKIEATIPVPEPGQPVSFEISVPEGAPYTAEITQWIQEAEPGSGNPDYTFSPEYTNDNEKFTDARYSLKVSFHAKEGYRFAPERYGIKYSPVIHIGEKEDWQIDHAGVLKKGKILSSAGSVFAGEVQRPVKIDTLCGTITGAAPEEKPGYTVAVPEDAPYTAVISSWYDLTQDCTMDPDSTFVRKSKYIAKLKVTPKPGYELSLDYDRASVQIQDEDGPVEVYYSYSVSREEYELWIQYAVDDPQVKSMDLAFNIPAPGTKAYDAANPVIIPDEDQNKYYLTEVAFYPADTPRLRGANITFEENVLYIGTVTAYAKEGYSLQIHTVCDSSMTDQYGCPIKYTMIRGGSVAPDGIARPSIKFDFSFMATNDYSVTFHVENGKWSDGTKADKVVRVPIEKGKAFLSDSQVPTGMTADPDYVGGEWDFIPNTGLYEITEDTDFIYRFTHKDEHATVTLKIINGRWKVDPTLSHEGGYHSDDIVITVPLVNGRGTLDSSLIPNASVADPGCLAGEWETRPNTWPDAVTEDITYTFTCERVVSEPMTYTLSYNGNGATSGKLPETMSKTVLSAYQAFPVVMKPGLQREGYVFTGWNSKADGSGRGPNVIDEFTVRYIEPSMTLYAQWEKAEEQVIRFVAPDALPGTVPQEITVIPDAEGNLTFTIPEDPVPVRDGYIFTGYQLVPVAESVKAKLRSAPALYQPGDRVVIKAAQQYQLIAQWKEHLLTLAYAGNGGTGIPAAESRQASSGAAEFTVSETVPTRKGYTFEGWAPGPDQEPSILPGQTVKIECDMVLYARWKKVPSAEPEGPVPPATEKPGTDDPGKPDTPDPGKPVKPEVPVKPEPQKASDIPKTGDSGLLLLWTGLALAALTGILLLLKQKRRLIRYRRRL